MKPLDQQNSMVRFLFPKKNKNKWTAKKKKKKEKERKVAKNKTAPGFFLNPPPKHIFINAERKKKSFYKFVVYPPKKNIKSEKVHGNGDTIRIG